MAFDSSVRATFRCISGAYVAENPEQRGVIEFYGGAFFELLPQVSYEYLLQGLFDLGYTIIAAPFQFSLDHMHVALNLVEIRDNIQNALGLPPSCREFPHFWLGHSVGCKIISLLEVLTNVPKGDGIANEPSVLMAPDIADTSGTVPWPFWKILDAIGKGVSPTKAQTKTLIEVRTDLFTLCGIVSFADDDIAGNVAGTLPKNGDSDVKWFVDELRKRDDARRRDLFLNRELPGGHLAPIGFRFGPWLVDAQPGDWIERVPKVHSVETDSDEIDALVMTLAGFFETLSQRLPTAKELDYTLTEQLRSKLVARHDFRANCDV